MFERMDTLEPTREWRRKRYRRTSRDWLTLAGLALIVMATTVVVVAAFAR